MSNYNGGSITEASTQIHVVSIPFHPMNPQQNPTLQIVEFQFLGSPPNIPVAVTNAGLTNGTVQQVSQGPDFWKAFRDMLNQLYPV